MNNTDKLSKRIEDLTAELRSLDIQKEFLIQHDDKIKKINKEAKLLRRKLLIINRKYVQEICKRNKVKSFTLTELLEDK